MIEALKKAREALDCALSDDRPYIVKCRSAIAAIDAVLAQAEAPADDWQKLYRRALNEANGLTNYIEYRPELRDAERRLAKIEADARDLQARAASAPAAPKEPQPDEIAAAVAAERERCAKVCDLSASLHWVAWDEHADPTDQGAAMEAERLAAEIRGTNVAGERP